MPNENLEQGEEQLTRFRKRNIVVVLLVALVGCVMSWMIVFETIKSQRNMQQARFQTDALLVTERVESQLRNASNGAGELLALRKAFPDINQEQFFNFVDSSDFLNSIHQAVLYVKLSPTKVDDNQPAQVIKSKYDFSIIHIWANHPKFKWGDKSVNLGSLPKFNDAFELARQTLRPVALPIDNKLGDIDIGSPFFTFITPVIDDNDITVSGYIVQFSFVKSALKPVVEDLSFLPLSVKVLDISFGSETKTIVFNEDKASDTAFAFGSHQADRTISAAQKNWIVRTETHRDGYQIDKNPIILILFISVTLTGVAVVMVWRQGRRSDTVSALVTKRTRALMEAHTELESHYLMLQNMNVELEDARLSAERANEAKSNFLTTISHELRTPLNAILGFSQILKDEILGDLGDKRYSEYSNDIHESGTHLLTIINDILDLAKLESGKVDIEYGVVFCQDIQDSTRSILNQLASRKKIDLTFEIDDDLPESLMGDEVRLRQILINLTSNAVKFTQKGYVKVRFMSCHLENGEMGWMMIVEDSGIGIPLQSQAHLFERFTQVQTSKNRQYGGTGLGLAICSELTKRMAGDISVESAEGKGSTFTVKLPLIEVDEESSHLDDNLI